MWDRRKKNRPSPPGAAAAPVSNGSALAPGAEASVRQLIANGRCKLAVENAKEIHKAQATATSEALLVDAYAARIQSLIDQNLAVEARALRELVRERYPSARERLDAVNGFAGIDAGGLEELVRPLNDPELSAERRTAIETAIARDARDLAALADCAALPPEHPLRVAASALQRAFLAVTAGPVSEEAVELPEVSHRSPLAPWKLLVRAIACFYRRDDEACRRYVEAIRPGSAPARLTPAIRAMLGDNPLGLTPPAAALVSSTTSDPAALQKPLEALGAAFDSHKNGAILKAIREAVQACRKAAPDRLEKLKQHISVRCAMAEVDVDKAEAAMGGGTSRRDPAFLRLFARGMEEVGDPENMGRACAIWEEFRRSAVRDGWFAANGPEAATLYLHMASTIEKLPGEMLEDLQERACRQDRKSREEMYFLFPEKLYERACALDPHFESFRQWMAWARTRKAGEAEKVAETWHKIRPTDIEPILLLMEEKEKRNAFHTSLKYLAKAERIDSVHPAVRRARLRLLAGAALRHLQQNKPDLARQKVAEMQTLPQALQGDRPAFLESLLYVASAVRGAHDEAATHRNEVERLLGSKAAAALLVFGVANAAKQSAIEKPPPLDILGEKELARLPEAVIRVMDLASGDMRIIQAIPAAWLHETTRRFPRSSPSLDVRQLMTLGASAVSAEQSDLAYAVSAAGLERGGNTEACFLLMRAMSLPLYERRAVCGAAAAQLARQHRQTDILERAVGLLADSPFDDLNLTAEQAATVVRKEKAERTYPTANRPGPDYSDILGDSVCDCPACRHMRGEPVDPFGDPDEDFDDEDDSDDFDEILDEIDLPPGMPPEIARIVVAEAARAVERGESLDSMMNRMFGQSHGSGRRRRKGRRR